MADYSKAEFVVLLIMLFLNLGFIFYILGSGSISGFSILGAKEASGPSDFVKDDQILYEDNKLIIGIDGLVLSNYADSESMLPTLGKDATGIGIKPKSIDQINVGDIVSFFRENKLIVHRVVFKGVDENGDYLVTKGDNNDVEDEKIRFSEIDSVLVGVLY